MNTAIQTCNTITLSGPKRKKLKSLLKELRGETLKGDFSWETLSSIVDCCTLLIKFLEGKHD